MSTPSHAQKQRLRDHTLAGAGMLLRPLPLAAMAVTAANDHLLKGAGLLPGWLTGKLSDVGGLFFFPLLVLAVGGALAPSQTPSRDKPGGGGRMGTWSMVPFIMAGAAFASLKLSPSACAWLRPVAAVTPDATDLLALPSLALSWWWLRRQERQQPARPSSSRAPAFARLLAVMAAVMITAATSRVPRIRFYVGHPDPPAWGTIEYHPGAEKEVDLVITETDGRGIGMLLRFRPRQDRQMIVANVELATALRRVAQATVNARVDLRAGHPAELPLRLEVRPGERAVAEESQARLMLFVDVRSPGGESTRHSWFIATRRPDRSQYEDVR